MDFCCLLSFPKALAAPDWRAPFSSRNMLLIGRSPADIGARSAGGKNVIPVLPNTLKALTLTASRIFCPFFNVSSIEPGGAWAFTGS
jgi:hypothetical protein